MTLPDTKLSKAIQWRKLLVGGFIGLSLVWLGTLLLDSLPLLISRVQDMNVTLLSGAVLLCLASGSVKGESFHQVLSELNTGKCSRRFAYRLQFLGQIARHLPGRIWGISYQILQAQNRVSPGILILCNAVLSLTAIFFTAWIATMVLVGGPHPSSLPITITAGVGAYFLCFLVSRRIAEHQFWSTGKSKFSIAVKRSVTALAGFKTRRAFALFSITAIAWILYLLAWGLLGKSYPELNFTDGMRLGAFYSIAWLVGFVAVFTPSGLGIRELVFVGLASSYSADVLALFAVMGRAWLLLNDFVLGLLSITVFRENLPNEQS